MEASNVIFKTSVENQWWKRLFTNNHHLITRVSITLLSDLVSVVCIREGPYYRGFFKVNLKELIFVRTHETVLEKESCPQKRGVDKERFNGSYFTQQLEILVTD